MVSDCPALISLSPLEGHGSILQTINPAVDEPIFLNAFVSKNLGSLGVDDSPSLSIVESVPGWTRT